MAAPLSYVEEVCPTPLRENPPTYMILHMALSSREEYNPNHWGGDIRRAKLNLDDSDLLTDKALQTIGLPPLILPESIPAPCFVARVWLSSFPAESVPELQLQRPSYPPVHVH